MLHCRLRLGDQVGEGAFGRVIKAEALGISGRTDSLTVAVKMLKGIFCFLKNHPHKRALLFCFKTK